MSDQKECSLPMAIKFCREKGGRIRRKDDRCWYDKTDFGDDPPMFTTEDVIATWIDDPPMFTTEDVIATWIYEPPQSAFKKFVRKQFGAYPGKLSEEIMAKRFWNAALMEAGKLLRRGEYEPVYEKDLEKLKEEE